MDFGQAASAPVQHYPRQLFYLFPKECKRQFSGGSHHGSLDQLKSWIKTEKSTSCPEQSLYFLEHAMNSQKVFLTIGVILMTVFGASALMAAETGRTKEIITLRGIPFDKPGVKDDVIKLCRQDYAQGVKNWSFFPKGKECSGQAIYFKFGNLDVDNDECSAGSLERTLRESVPRNIDERFISHILRCNAFIEFREDGALVSFEMRASPEKLSELAVLLTDKYGKPKAKFSKVANKVGGEFEQGEFTWVDIQGTTIFIQLRVNTVDEGSVRIMSASRLVESLDKKQQETAKQRGNL